MLMISAEELDAHLDFPNLVAALRRAHLDGQMDCEDMLRREPGEGPSRFFVRFAWQPGADFGVKLASIFPDNPNREPPLPTVQGPYILFDGTDGRPVAIIEGACLTAWKTAADSALGSALLSRPDARVLLMVGAGAMAEPLVRAHTAVRPGVDRVLLWNRGAARAEALSRRLHDRGIETEVVPDLEAAVRRAEIVCCATATREPLVLGRWLAPGTHLDLVGAYRPDMREADDEAVRRARVFVDSRRSTVEDCGDIAEPLRRGVIRDADILGDLYDLCRGAPGRLTRDEITLYKNGGGGHLDLMTARTALEAIRGRDASSGDA